MRLCWWDCERELEKCFSFPHIFHFPISTAFSLFAPHSIILFWWKKTFHWKFPTLKLFDFLFFTGWGKTFSHPCSWLDLTRDFPEIVFHIRVIPKGKIIVKLWEVSKSLNQQSLTRNSHWKRGFLLSFWTHQLTPFIINFTQNPWIKHLLIFNLDVKQKYSWTAKKFFSHLRKNSKLMGKFFFQPLSPFWLGLDPSCGLLKTGGEIVSETDGKGKFSVKTLSH